MRKRSDSRGGKKATGWERKLRLWGFLLVVFVAYGVLFFVFPHRTFVAFKASINIFLQIILPLVIAFAIMFTINFFVGPVQMARYLGKNAGIKGLFLSSIAGILSMGPIYAWYPLLKSLGERGASDFYLANFLSCRTVKPFLLPVMIYYFGWVFTIILNVLILAGAPFTAFVTNIASQDKKKREPI
ncbi:hypothetical protein SAMN02746041_00576 [Desulfacinum hydrothermale DSM 13146]|uniref:Permease n=1 Tax=Desulfacinum hydrothermale DSM 13146 TaxID=1121390 RepID=A0A1W1X4Q3_9BACT|nr:permease [Desulfacinum hydrothermale]SMC18882.1 hypothetical protein SAMN02746041_00576 [Desulfacinum hydrothermale DSM 13146]